MTWRGKAKRITMAEAKRRCRLSDEQVRRAREMGFFPHSLVARIPAPAEHWKPPVGDWITRETVPAAGTPPLGDTVGQVAPHFIFH